MAPYSSPVWDLPADMAALESDLSIKTEADTLIHLPLKEHRQTFIILHGRGSSANKFAPALLSSTTSKNETLQSAFPHAKILFPTAPKSQPSILDGSVSSDAWWQCPKTSNPVSIHQTLFNENTSKSSSPVLVNQWFDNWFLPDYTNRESLPIPGLYASCSYMHKLLEREIQSVGKDNVVLWGSRLGCAVALSTMLTWGWRALCCSSWNEWVATIQQPGVGFCQWRLFGRR